MTDPIRILVDRIRAAARDCGYAIGTHGTQRRDLDLIAVPWVEEAVTATELVARICERCDLRRKDDLVADDEYPKRLPHGRLGFVLYQTIRRRDDPRYIDLSVVCP